MRTRALALSVAALATVSIGLAGCSSRDTGTTTASAARSTFSDSSDIPGGQSSTRHA